MSSINSVRKLQILYFSKKNKKTKNRKKKKTKRSEPEPPFIHTTKVVTSKTSLFVIGLFCSRHSICLNIVF